MNSQAAPALETSPKPATRAPRRGQNWLPAAGLARGSGPKLRRLWKHLPASRPPQVGRPPGGGARPGAPQVAASALSHSLGPRPPGIRAGTYCARPLVVQAPHRRARRFLRPNAGATPASRTARPGLSPKFGGRRDGGSGGRGDYPTTGLRPGSCWNMRPEPQVRGPAARLGVGGGEWVPRRGATSADPARLERRRRAARGDRCLLSRPQSPGARHLSLGTLGLSGHGSGRETETREPGAVGRLLGAQQVGDSVPPGAQSAEPEAFLTFCCYFVCFSLFDSYWTMFTLLVLLSQVPIVTFAFPHCTRSPKESRHAGEEGKPGSRVREHPPPPRNPSQVLQTSNEKV